MLYTDLEDSDFKEKQIKEMTTILRERHGQEPTSD